MLNRYRFVNWFGTFRILYTNLISYPSPINLNIWWNFGSLAFIFLIIQIFTGIFLAMHYVPDELFAFSTVEYIMRDVDYGWLVRYIHANGASMFFVVVYIHLFRGLYYGSFYYPRRLLWITGVLILLLMIITAFVGYVLPWGQMSYWAATVITNLVSTVPVIGGDIVRWLWGGFSVNTYTLNRFFSIHYLLPFLILGLVIVHLILLHETGSNNPLGIDFHKTKNFVYFNPYYTVKDLFGILIVLILFFFIVFFEPNLTIHPDNYIRASPMVTPSHIVPEWYFLPFYAILRAVPNKLLGVLTMLFSIIILILLPFISFYALIRAPMFNPFYKFFFWFFLFNCLVLGWLGGQPAEYPFSFVAALGTFFYFISLILMVTLPAFVFNYTKFERFTFFKPKPMKQTYQFAVRDSQLIERLLNLSFTRPDDYEKSGRHR